jgi:small subunit ribosomal protein S10
MSTMFSDKIRIRLKAYDSRVLDTSTTEIATPRSGRVQYSGPVPLPTGSWMSTRRTSTRSRAAVRDSDAQA